MNSIVETVSKAFPGKLHTDALEHFTCHQRYLPLAMTAAPMLWEFISGNRLNLEHSVCSIVHDMSSAIYACVFVCQLRKLDRLNKSSQPSLLHPLIHFVCVACVTAIYYFSSFPFRNSRGENEIK